MTDYVTNPYDTNTVVDNTNTIPVITTPPNPSPIFDANPVNTQNTILSPTYVRNPVDNNYNVGFFQGFRDIYGDGIQRGDFSKAFNHGLNYFNSSQLEKAPVVGNVVSDYKNDMTGAEKFNTIAGGLQTLANTWGGLKMNKMAQEQAKFQRNMWNQQWNAQKNQINDASAYRALVRNNGNQAAAQKEYNQTKI